MRRAGGAGVEAAGGDGGGREHHGGADVDEERRRARDPEMHRARKGKQRHFGMKMRVGSDAETGVAHSLAATAANEPDVARAHRLPHGKDKRA